MQPAWPSPKPHVSLSEETAEYDYVWVRRLTAVAIYGFFLLQASRVMGLPPGTHGVALRILGLLLAAMLVILVLQNRVLVATWLRESTGWSTARPAARASASMRFGPAGRTAAAARRR